jgi:hypothetical protein
MNMGAINESELFPSAMLKRDMMHASYFHTGKILITGTRDEQMIKYVVMPTLIALDMLGVLITYVFSFSYSGI